MKKTYFLLLTLFCYFISCSQSSIENKRQATINEIINAIAQNDTFKIFKLVDTSFCFDLNGKEGFMHNIHSLNAAFTKEQLEISKTNFLKEAKNGDETYKITFPLKHSTYDSVQMEFSFKPNAYGQAFYFNTFFKRNTISPLEAAPSGSDN